MTVEKEAVETERRSAPVHPGVVVAYALLLAGVLGWFLYGVFVQRQGFVDSVGESLGTGFALLLVVSIVGSLRRRD
jgi:high-affinity Fe2+/Pb2+ permease